MRTGLSLTTTLFVIFLVMKLTGNITWSWIWVTCPLWITTAAIVGVVLLATLLGAPITLVRKARRTNWTGRPRISR